MSSSIIPIAATFEEVQLSLGRCCNQTAFLDAFYGNLFQSSPVVAPMFAHTDMARQKKLLKDGISFLLMYSKGDELGKMKVEKLALSHNRDHINVKPEYYALWIESLMKAVAKFDPKFSPALDEAWRKAVQKGIDEMKAGYRKRP
jgi:hemoglobin-like flavoprotein